MLGSISFLLVMTIFGLLSWYWMGGQLQEAIANEREKAKRPGREFHFSFWRWDVAVRINRTFWVRLAFMVLGPAAILGLSLAYAQIMPLRVAFMIYVLPSYLAMIVLGVVYPEYGKRALVGYSAGVLATILYDVVRMFVVIGLGLPDPIPHIGALWLNTDTNLWWLGYLWRFFGNGGGMGIVFSMLPKFWFDLKGGWIYGDVIGSGMYLLMFFSVATQIHLFPLNYIVFVNGILGHWAYGLALGWLFSKTPLVHEPMYEHIIMRRRRPLSWRE